MQKKGADSAHCGFSDTSMKINLGPKAQKLKSLRGNLIGNSASPPSIPVSGFHDS